MKKWWKILLPVAVIAISIAAFLLLSERAGNEKQTVPGGAPESTDNGGMAGVMSEEADVPETAPFGASDVVEEESPGDLDAEEAKPPVLHGSAGKIAGTTLILSIFADDSSTSWNESDTADVTAMQDSLQYLSIATEWLTAQCNVWGAEPEFIYDWSQDASLFYRTAFEGDMTEEDGYKDAVAYIEAAVSSDELLEKYGADNILYIFYYHTSLSNRTPSWSYVYEVDDPDTYYEVCNIYIGSSEGIEPPAVYAHEILHAFGAPDLYAFEEDGGNCGITQEYVEYCASTNSNDIMFTVRDISTGQYVYDKITNEFTALDAYYVGLADDCPEIKAWGLGVSEYR